MTLREWITDPNGDPGETIMIDGSPVTRQRLLDDVDLADRMSAAMAAATPHLRPTRLQG